MGRIGRSARLGTTNQPDPRLVPGTVQAAAGGPQVAGQILGQGQVEAIVGRRPVQAQRPVIGRTRLGFLAGCLVTALWYDGVGAVWSMDSLTGW